MLEYRQLFAEGNKVLWESPGNVKDETSSEIIAERNQAPQTKYLEKRTLQTEPKSRHWTKTRI
jgi:hypothetical protein